MAWKVKGQIKDKNGDLITVPVKIIVLKDIYPDGWTICTINEQTYIDGNFDVNLPIGTHAVGDKVLVVFTVVGAYAPTGDVDIAGACWGEVYEGYFTK
jgi:hypothetical protein